MKYFFIFDIQGNTVLHYALSHNHFAVVSVLLDSKVCNVDMVNQAGYTPVMLASLAPLQCDRDRAIASRLFGMGDINRRAQQVNYQIKSLKTSIKKSSFPKNKKKFHNFFKN